MIHAVAPAAPERTVDHGGVRAAAVVPGVGEVRGEDMRLLLLGLHAEMILRCCQITPRDAARCEVTATMGPVLVCDSLVIPDAVLAYPTRNSAPFLRCPPSLPRSRALNTRVHHLGRPRLSRLRCIRARELVGLPRDGLAVTYDLAWRDMDDG